MVQIKFLELVPYMGYVTSSCAIIKLFTFHPRREVVWYREGNKRLRPRSFRFQAGQRHHPVVWCGQVGVLWISGFFFVVVVPLVKWARSHLMHKAAMQCSVTDFSLRGMTHLLNVSLMHAFCLALHCTLPQ